MARRRTTKTINPKLTAAINDRGLAYIAKGETDHAIADFDQAIQIAPKDSLAYNNRGLAYRNKGETDQAINNYDQAIIISPPPTHQSYTTE